MQIHFFLFRPGSGLAAPEAEEVPDDGINFPHFSTRCRIITLNRNPTVRLQREY